MLMHRTCWVDLQAILYATAISGVVCIFVVLWYKQQWHVLNQVDRCNNCKGSVNDRASALRNLVARMQILSGPPGHQNLKVSGPYWPGSQKNLQGQCLMSRPASHNGNQHFSELYLTIGGSAHLHHYSSLKCIMYPCDTNLVVTTEIKRNLLWQITTGEKRIERELSMLSVHQLTLQIIIQYFFSNNRQV